MMQKDKSSEITDDYDSPWKDIIEPYFREFMEFFFPEACNDIDWSKGYEFLDKEFQKIVKEAETGRRYVDKLARVWLKTGSEEWALVHVDVQSQYEKEFAERMYVYNYRLFDRFHVHAVSFAVLGDQSGKWRPNKFTKKKWGCEVTFKFPVIKLARYKKQMKFLKQSNNPFAIITLAHLKNQSTAKDREKRLNEKIQIIKHLYQKGFGRQDIINLFRFIDWLMFLPEELDHSFMEEIAKFEGEKKMQYITSVERVGYKRGMLEGEALIIARLIAAKFGFRDEKALEKLKNLSAEDLLNLSTEILKLDSLNAVLKWIDDRTNTH
ncbi:DUF4351 domain-containing protein [Desulfonema magnum]|uniref:DUF4351 n=1 Tax=Desulfonema magnum TaxID=45655 RepID=A0A975BQM2_9BACT|nr:DUF4351 domain-containing protein [Desulfonema magnum]QTA89841.1 DUF4351 [Desulfonema magnum]